ncbi:hypothetical protein C8Q79DRAFT_1012383 [Trametes meyenii]|nr:hypothetical protein C8Q79DRAFT_1012383 [Trametes meyenii]
MPSVVGTSARAVSGTLNVKKRSQADSDAEQRDAKRVKSLPAGDIIADETKKAGKEKRKRRKKKRKAPVVPQAEVDAERRIAPKASGSRSRSRSVTLAGSSSLSPEPHSHPAERKIVSPPHPSVAAVPLRDASPSRSTSSKGKERATPDDPVAQVSQQQITITDLRDQVSTKTSLVSQHEDLLSTFQQSLSCQICLDLMHRPFALAPCGHSACYQCLVNWFRAPPPDLPANAVPPAWLRKKTCPHCRTVVRERPIEIWTIKEMVASFVKSKLVPAAVAPAAADAPAAAQADPWSGIFRPAVPAGGNQNGLFIDGPPEFVQQFMGLRDDDDGGIYRCIDCHHEIWDGACSGCGRVYPGHAPDEDFDEDDEELLGELDLLQDHQWGPQAFGWHGHHEYVMDLNEYGEPDPNHPIQPFFMPAPLPPPGFAAPLEEDSDSDSNFTSDHDMSHSSDYDSEDDDDDDDVAPVGRPRGGRRLMPGRFVDGEDAEDGDEQGYESSFIDDGEAAHPPPGPRPRRRGASVDVDGDEVIDLTEVDEEEGEGVGPVRLGRRRGAGVRARGPIVISDDDEDDEEAVRDEGSSMMGDADLAAEIAIREFELYGDDGSVPRGRARYDEYSEDDIAEYDDERYDGEGYNDEGYDGEGYDGEGYDDERYDDEVVYYEYGF